MPRLLTFLNPVLLFFVAWSIPSLVAAVEIVDVERGTLVTKGTHGEVLPVPLVSTDVDINVTGPIARTTVEQSFQNDSDQWVEALYLFPLPEDAAVDRMQLIIGERLIEGEIKENEEAKQIYETARTEGYKAALVEQDRPNLFHTSVANIPPGGQIKVRIEYQQSLIWRDNTFSLRFPLAITPRFSTATQEVVQTTEMSAGWQVAPSERPQVRAIEGMIEPETTISVSLAPGFEVGLLESDSHPITVEDNEGTQVSLTVGDGSTLLTPRDFILRWAPVSTQAPQAAFFSEEHETGHYGLVTLTPPDLELPYQTARDVVFVIDTSGSMEGESMAAAQRALRAGIVGLEPGDAFNVIEFHTMARSLFKGPTEVNKITRSLGLKFVHQLYADGGTNMRDALELALKDTKETSTRLRQIVFITDGAVDNEQELFEFIRDHLGYARLFTVGIGSAPNSHFMKEAAIAGRGTYTYIDGNTDAEAAITTLFEKVSQPVMTNIEVSGSGIEDIRPQFIPDLYKGEPLAITARLTDPKGEVLIKGLLGDVAFRQTVTLTRSQSDSSQGIATDWAKRSIDELQRSFLNGASEEEAKERITELGLAYHLVTPYTSLVGVDKTPSRPQEVALNENAVPLQTPDGQALNSTSSASQNAQAPGTVQFAKGAHGYQVSILIGLLLMLIAGIGTLVLRRRGAAQA